jgi:glyoxylase-like metal-dependent hydrolase (beta-lactamase superfamily II)/rhodanese-related sulfurtransferase
LKVLLLLRTSVVSFHPKGIMMPESTSGPVWTASHLLQQLERNQKFFVLDVRSRDAFEQFHLEGRAPLPTVNMPYFELLEMGGKDDMLDSLVAGVEQGLVQQLPKDMLILSVCAKGQSSEYVAQALRRMGYDVVGLQGGTKAWSEYYAIHTIAEAADLAVYQVSRPARGCLSYVIAGEGKAIVIDPLRHLSPYLDLARDKGLTITAIIDTHGHADHISGGTQLRAKTGAPYYLHPYDGIHPMDVLPATFSYEYLREGQRFSVGRQELTALHIPGHTLGLVAFRLGDRYLFTGDSIFIRSISRPDLGGKADAWAPLHGRSLRRLLELPGGIMVLPGHFSSLGEADESGRFGASLNDLKKRNDGLIALQKESEDGFVRYLLASLPASIPEYVDIKRVNAGLLSPGEDDAATLETGKNVCALAQAYATTDGGKG